MTRTESDQKTPAPARPQQTPGEKHDVAVRGLQGLSDVLQFLCASAIAALAAYAVWTELPEELDVRTDIVGYPIYSNFNIDRYFWLYYLVAGFVPLITLAVLLVLRRVIPRVEALPRRRRRSPEEEAPLAPASHNEIAAVGVARVLFVGSIFGLETAIALSRESYWVYAIGLPVTVGYALLASLAALGLRRVVEPQTTFWERLSLANAIAVSFSIAALYAVSRSTELTVTSTGRVHEYSWFPLWLAAGMTGAALVWVGRAALRGRVGGELRTLERRLLLVVAGPVALLLFLSQLPGAWGAMDMFHEGELLAGGRLVEGGAFPWRDVIFIHGFLTDAELQSVGFSLFEHSRWGYVAGMLVLVGPVYWISTYYLFAYLFHRNWLFLVGAQLAVILGVVYDGHLRFIGLPIVLVLMGALLSKPTWVRAFAFMALLIAQTIVTPEAALAAFAVLVSILAFEAYYYDRSRPLVANFRRTVMCAGAGALLTAMWAAFLLPFGALDDFVFASFAFASDHQLTGGVPVIWTSDRYRFIAYAPVVLIVVAFWYFVLKILRRGSFRINDWVVGSVALLVALYYQKFLARSDHAAQPYALALPLLAYVLYRLIGAAEDGLAWLARRRKVQLPIRHPITALALIALLLYAPLTIRDVVRDAPGRLDATVAQEAETRSVGYINPEGTYRPLLRNLNRVLGSYLEPEDELFDFTNNPAIFHYLLEREPATRYYHVSMAIRKEAQEDLVEELERSRPKLVVFSSTSYGLPVWDGIPNPVRHYEISQYILDHYTPLTTAEGFVFFARRDAHLPAGGLAAGEPDPSELYFRTYLCDWGTAPNFLTSAPSAESSSRPLLSTPRQLGRMVLINGWAVDREARAPAARVVALLDGRIVAEGAPSRNRSDVAAQLKSRRFTKSGFTLQFTAGAVPRDRLPDVRVYGVSRSGKATELVYGAGTDLGVGQPPSPKVLRLGDARLPVVPGLAEGAVDSYSMAGQVLALDVPQRVRDGYNWLEIETGSPLNENRFSLSDHPAAPERQISFRTLDRGERTVRVQVGSCSQWHGYRSNRLYLSAERPVAIRELRFYR